MLTIVFHTTNLYVLTSAGGRPRRVLRLSPLRVLCVPAQVDGQAADHGFPGNHHVSAIAADAELVRQGCRDAAKRSIHVQDAVW